MAGSAHIQGRLYPERDKQQRQAFQVWERKRQEGLSPQEILTLALLALDNQPLPALGDMRLPQDLRESVDRLNALVERIQRTGTMLPTLVSSDAAAPHPNRPPQRQGLRDAIAKTVRRGG